MFLVIHLGANIWINFKLLAYYFLVNSFMFYICLIILFFFIFEETLYIGNC